MVLPLRDNIRRVSVQQQVRLKFGVHSGLSSTEGGDAVHLSGWDALQY
ncbi:hypothetical protein ACFLUC_03800 [Chloroflexota bacterium]